MINAAATRLFCARQYEVRFPLTLLLLLSLPSCGKSNELSTLPGTQSMNEKILLSTDVANASLTEANLQRDESGRWRLSKNGKGYAPEGVLLTKPYDLGLGGKAISLDWMEQWTAPLHYEKYVGNPVFGPGQSGAWDGWTNGVSIVSTNSGKTYRMYYAGKGGIGFAEADVADPTVWKENPASPVLIPRESSWEGDKINQPRVVKVTDTHWRMYYTGWGYPGPGLPKAPGTSWALGLAESFDGGTTWKRYQDAPILERGAPDSPDGGAAVVPMVVRVDDKWMMWYTAAYGNVTPARDVHLCLATSNDGIHWQKYSGNPVFSEKVEGKHTFASRCYIRYDDGVFRMWYSYSEGAPSYRIRYAESLDGIHWEKAPVAPALDVSPKPAWDDERVEYPEIQVVDGIYRLWFCGNKFGSVGYATARPETGVSVMVRSGETPQPDIGWTSWTEVRRMKPIIARRFVQVQARLWSRNAERSPMLNRICIKVLGK
jgi:predicted GH43/DUF377 family glycosyl hydrolase